MKKPTLMKFPPVLKNQVFCMIYKNKLKNFTILLQYWFVGSLKLDEQWVMKKYAIVAFQSTNTEQAQRNQRSRGSTNSPSTPTALLFPKKLSTSSGSKSFKRRKIRRTVADSEREWPAQKTKREEGAAEEEDSELYETPENDSDSATTEKTKTKTKKWQNTPAEEKLLIILTNK